jgi:hypothetical protein
MSEAAPREIVRRTPLPFDPVGKTRYTAEEIRALFEGLPPPTEDDRTVLAAHPDRPATREELMAFVEEMWALHRAETEDAAG